MNNNNNNNNNNDNSYINCENKKKSQKYCEKLNIFNNIIVIIMLLIYVVFAIIEGGIGAIIMISFPLVFTIGIVGRSFVKSGKIPIEKVGSIAKIASDINVAIHDADLHSISTSLHMHNSEWNQETVKKYYPAIPIFIMYFYLLVCIPSVICLNIGLADKSVGLIAHCNNTALFIVTIIEIVLNILSIILATITVKLEYGKKRVLYEWKVISIITLILGILVAYVILKNQ